MGKYWYKFYTEFCPSCGVEDSWKERRYTPKPEDPAERYSYSEVWCRCCFP